VAVLVYFATNTVFTDNYQEQNSLSASTLLLLFGQTISTNGLVIYSASSHTNTILKYVLKCCWQVAAQCKKQLMYKTLFTLMALVSASVQMTKCST
jgi:hypothetical protein